MNKLLSVIMSIAVAAALLTGSIAAPICLRSFYYAHIGPLELEEKSGLSENEIRQAYDEVLDYCTGKSDEFSAGVLPFSADGAAHFADCRELFILDFRVFPVSAANSAFKSASGCVAQTESALAMRFDISAAAVFRFMLSP